MRRVPEPLIIHDATTPGDALEVKDADLGHGYIYLTTGDLTDTDDSGELNNPRSVTLLTRDEVRKLFNWLGVWLHVG